MIPNVKASIFCSEYVYLLTLISRYGEEQQQLSVLSEHVRVLPESGGASIQNVTFLGHVRQLRQECGNRHKNRRNRKNTIFCIEAISRFFFRTKKYFSEIENKIKKIFFLENFENPKKSKFPMKKSKNFLMKFFDFSSKILFFWILKNFQKNIFFGFVFDLRKIFFDPEIKIRTQRRCRKLCSFDSCGFYGDSCTPGGAIANKHFALNGVTLCYIIMQIPKWSRKPVHAR